MSDVRFSPGMLVSPTDLQHDGHAHDPHRPRHGAPGWSLGTLLCMGVALAAFVSAVVAWLPAPGDIDNVAAPVTQAAARP